MAHVWTHGTWTVKPGREREFEQAWTRFAGVGTAQFNAPAPPTLLRDRERPNVFFSFGPWPDDEAIQRFRGSELFKQTIHRMGELLEDFEARTLDEVYPG